MIDLDPRRPQALLADCPAYRPTPIGHHSIAGRPVMIKDETGRMGLGSFKALGGVYAVAVLLQEALGHRDRPSSFLMSEPVREAAGGITFVCASAGNHGMAVAAGARLFGARCRVHLSEQVDESFIARLRGKGAEIIRAGAVYDDSIAAAIEDAARTGAIHLADGSWLGYSEAPRLVMEGYTVLVEEMAATFADEDSWPSHVFLQAGVGGLAAAVTATIRTRWPHQPEIIVVEPEAAPCLKASFEAGRMVTVDGPVSAMGRLDCKRPSLLAFDILREAADHFVTISEKAAISAAETAGDLGYATTPSGAAGLAALLLMHGSPPNPLVILTEGALP